MNTSFAGVKLFFAKKFHAIAKKYLAFRAFCGILYTLIGQEVHFQEGLIAGKKKVT
jgi:hypothetical protein